MEQTSFNGLDPGGVYDLLHEPAVHMEGTLCFTENVHQRQKLRVIIVKLHDFLILFPKLIQFFIVHVILTCQSVTACAGIFTVCEILS